MNWVTKMRSKKSMYLLHAIVPIPEFKPITDSLSEGPPLLTQALQSANLSGFLTSIFNFAISVGAILAVLRLGYAGFIYMTTDAVNQKTDAREIIKNAVIGLLLLLAIVLILEQINPDILKINLDLGGSSTGTTVPQGGVGGFPSLQ